MFGRWTVSLASSACVAAQVAVTMMLLGFSSPTAAREYYVGEPVEINGLRIEPRYLTGIRLDHDPSHDAAARDPILLVADVQATRDENHGFMPGSWVPYLPIQYRLTKGGARFMRTGWLYPMMAKDGAHYASTVRTDGDGTYHLTLIIYPPSASGLARHVDPETGVPPWWRRFSQTWIFTYPSRPK